MTEYFAQSRFHDYIVFGNTIGETGTYYLASYDPTKKVKGLFQISNEDLRYYCIDKDLLDKSVYYRDEEDDFEPLPSEEEYNFEKFIKLAYNRSFIREMWLKIPLYKIFTDDDGYETVMLGKGKTKRLI